VPGGRSNQWKPGRKLSASTEPLTGSRYRTAVELHQALHHGQPQPQPTLAPIQALVRLRERLEESGPKLLGNPDPSIAHPQFGGVAVVVGIEDDRHLTA